MRLRRGGQGAGVRYRVTWTAASRVGIRYGLREESVVLKSATSSPVTHFIRAEAADALDRRRQVALGENHGGGCDTQYTEPNQDEISTHRANIKNVAGSVAQEPCPG